jgi:hypothetical protein
MTPPRPLKVTREAEEAAMAADLPPSSPLADPPRSVLLPKVPDSRSPVDLVIAEGVAIRVLTRLYGWTWLEAGILRRPGA